MYAETVEQFFEHVLDFHSSYGYLVKIVGLCVRFIASPVIVRSPLKLQEIFLEAAQRFDLVKLFFCRRKGADIEQFHEFFAQIQVHHGLLTHHVRSVHVCLTEPDVHEHLPRQHTS